MRLYQALFALLIGAVLPSWGGGLSPIGLRCEYLRNPEGIDALQPRLSWMLKPSSESARGQTQSAWRVLAASSEQNLEKNLGDLWDSGKITSEQSTQVQYAGLPLRSEQAVFWKVRVWDQADQPSAWSGPGRWSMGLLQPASNAAPAEVPGQWTGQWIGRDEVRSNTPFSGSWVWFPEGSPEESARVGKAYFRRVFDLPDGRVVTSAKWYVAGDDRATSCLNGNRLGQGDGFKAVKEFDVAEYLKARQNTLAVMVENAGKTPNPSGLIGLLRVEFDSGEPLLIGTDDQWLSTLEEFSGWEQPGFDDSTWLHAKVLGDAGMQPWGEVSMPEDRRLPARYVRKEFAVEKRVRRATVYYSGLGLSELHLNGQKVGTEVLSPGLTEYDKRVFYLTHDVTRLLRRGSNAVGVILGNGRFFAPRGMVPTKTRTYGYPKLLFQLQIEYADGSSARVVSDGSWKLSADGPIRANNEYDGEEYDATCEFEHWSEPGFDDSGWVPAREVKAPEGRLAAQMIEPIRVVETRRPIGMTEPKPGTFVFDMGQNMVGWCRLHVAGARGTIVRLRHAETLKPDGTLYVENLRSARVTDTYVMKGKGKEVYEPRFTYHGFRFVEVTDFPGRPTLDSLQGRVVHDDLEPAGEFTCSDPLLNRIYSNVVWGIRGNYRSIPTDCPQRDERQGWLGDRSAESRGEAYVYNVAPLYAKWLRDMEDAQKPSGSVPDVCPSYWPIYSDDVTWPSSLVMIPGMLYDQFGDLEAVRRAYPAARGWMRHMSGFITNGIISCDNYGDWCVPPEDPQLIHSKDPARKTDPALLASAYFFHDARLMNRYAELLGLDEDAREFALLAENLRAGINDKFYDPEGEIYDNGSQTSCVLPLAFDLVPEGGRPALLRHLVEKIAVQSENHVGTGLIGGQWLMRVLTGNGNADLACTIASQNTYPSWGYMVEQGATTIWELWNGDTADPAMNSGNHVMLVGDLLIWMFENLAGIKPDSERPGFKHIVMRPETPPGLDHVRAAHQSPYGRISSEWRRVEREFRWRVQVPPNTRATLYIPADSPGAVREGGKPLDEARGVRLAGYSKGRQAVEVGSGIYLFESSVPVPGVGAP